MRIQILSDLHVEFGEFDPPAVDADLTILAGDIHTAARGPAWALRNFDRPVVFVPGNHDYWGINLQRFGREAEKRMEQVPPEHRRAPAIHILENGDTVELDGVRIIGATLWIDFMLAGELRRRQAMEYGHKVMNDFKKVRWGNEFRKLAPTNMQALHIQHLAAIKRELAKPFEGTTILVTHHPWHPESLKNDNQEIGLDEACYATDLRETLLMEGVSPDLVISGHTHKAMDTNEGSTRFISNPRGYSTLDKTTRTFIGDVADFDPTLVIDVGVTAKCKLPHG
jgi:predicted phosphodiesterase